jgi:putative membrane-bound dehydrogenase-like protein
MRFSNSIPVFFLLFALVVAQQGLPPGIKNTQDPKDIPPTPEEAVRLFHPAKGFNVTLFAGEPHVCQPIAMDFDDRGRLWVAECFSYPTWSKDGKGQDRILIFEDTDGDGKVDHRTVFYDKASNLTGLAVGHGGVWVCSCPNLLFIPFKVGKEVTAGKPVVVLDGFNLKSGHNMVNGLMWGPDGWLWGRHGITAEARIGKPGTPADKRIKMNCAIWRYHPKRQVFEVVAHGTTNPWGMDFDDHGEAFFTNCVIGHLWHVVPGARYQRMYGQDYNPHSYKLIASTSDHLHWGGGHWTTSRSGQIHSEAGGGHAHVGGMIYLGDNWPDQYRNNIFMCNLHGNRINRDVLVRQGNSYVGKHATDFLRSDNHWFRGITLDYGPDGGVYVADWCDLGECHDYDGVHRSSGRIYKISYGKPTPVVNLDLAKKSDADLVRLQLHKNDWYVRHARRLLTERAWAGKPMAQVHKALFKMFDDNPDVTRKLRAMWALYTTGGIRTDWLYKQLEHADEHVRSWAIRLLCDEGKPGPVARVTFAAMAKNDQSGLVRLYLASAMQKIEPADRFAIADNLAKHAEDAGDRVQPLMIWYGIEPAIVNNKFATLNLISQSKMPKLREFIARRLTEGETRDGLESLLDFLSGSKETAVQRDLLQGIREGLKGRKKVPMPAGWKTAYPRLSASSLAEVRESAQVLGLVFNDARALSHLRKTLTDPSLPTPDRLVALNALVSQAIPDLVPDLFKALKEPALRGPALRALAAYANDDTPKIILGLYKNLTSEEKQDAIATLASRPSYALALLDAVEKKQVPRGDLTPFTARQLQDLFDNRVNQKLEKVWGQLRQTSAEKKKLIVKYKALLKSEVLAKADRSQGRLVFKKTCYQCHMLFGDGNKIGPDLTGSGRFDLHYLLENMIDPSAVIPSDYRLTNIFTKNGRLIPGIIVEETERSLTVQTATERLVLSKSDIERRRDSSVSLMPEGQIEQMTFTELRDLIAYLQSKEQVALPK